MMTEVGRDGIPWTDKQTPMSGEIFLDHVGWMVPDMVKAASVFDALGFTLTPLSIHHDKNPETGEAVLVGSSNRLAMLSFGYLEVLTPVDGADTPVSRHMQDAMARNIGVHLLAFSVADAELYATGLEERGFSLSPTVHLRRVVESQGGNQVEAAFTVVRAELGSIPEGRLQAVTHLTPEHVWQSQLMPKENAIYGLSEVTLVVEDPAASAERLSRFTLSETVDLLNGGTAVQLNRGRIVLLSQEAAHQQFGPNVPDAPATIGVGLYSSNINQTADFMFNRNISFKRTEVGLILPPEQTCGVFLTITAR